MLLYFQEAFKDFYKHTLIKQICNDKAGYVSKKHLYYKFVLVFKKAKREIQLTATELRNGKVIFFLVFL